SEAEPNVLCTTGVDWFTECAYRGQFANLTARSDFDHDARQCDPRASTLPKKRILHYRRPAPSNRSRHHSIFLPGGHLMIMDSNQPGIWLWFGPWVVVASAMASAGLICLVRPLLLRYALVQPNARSSHAIATPQGGGVAVLAATI